MERRAFETTSKVFFSIDGSTVFVPSRGLIALTFKNEHTQVNRLKRSEFPSVKIWNLGGNGKPVFLFVLLK